MKEIFIMLPLEGIKVLDLTKALAGGFAVMNVADLGADVIKVENTNGIGDDCRGNGPFINGEGSYFMSINRNKRDITLDLKSLTGQEIFWKLIDWADVITENFKPGTMEKLGLSYKNIIERKPDIIYAALSGYGQTGPYKNKAAYDIVIQAAGGIMSITGPEGGAPTRVGVSIGDLAAGLYFAMGITAAICHKKMTGEGQMVDVAMLDCQVALLENAIVRYTYDGTVAKPTGNRHPSATPFQPYTCADDKELMLAVGTDKMWERFCNASGHQELLEDPLMKTNYLRTEHYSHCNDLVSKVMLEKTSDEWQKVLDAVSVPAATLNTVDMVVNNPQVNARHMIIETNHPIAGKIRTAGSPLNFSKSGPKPNRPSPIRGQHNEEVLHDMIGYTKEEIEAMRKIGAIL